MPPRSEAGVSWARVALWLWLSAWAAPVHLGAQQAGFSGYYLNVGTRVGDSPLNPSGVSDFQRLRLMFVQPLGPALLDVGYEHTLVLREANAPGAQLFTAAGTSTSGDWLDLAGELDARERSVWRHRVDRLSLQLDLGNSADLVVGRQPISWATTLILTPSDPFSPFDPADPFREYRIGVDAARLRYYRGAFTQVEVVVRPAKVAGDQTLTALARVASNYGGWDMGVWAGSLHDTFGAAAFLSGGVGAWALRAEGVVRDVGGITAFRSTLGVDRVLPVGGKDLYVVLEYHRDGLGSTTSEGLVEAASNPAFAQGEVQVLGRDVGAAQLSYQIHPLVATDVLLLGNLRDGSFLFGPGVGYSATHSMAIRLGAFVGVGDGASLSGQEVSLGSEFGASPGVVFVSFNLFF